MADDICPQWGQRSYGAFNKVTLARSFAAPSENMGTTEHQGRTGDSVFDRQGHGTGMTEAISDLAARGYFAVSDRRSAPFLYISLNCKIKRLKQETIGNLHQVSKTLFRQLFADKENQAEIRLTAFRDLGPDAKSQDVVVVPEGAGFLQVPIKVRLLFAAPLTGRRPPEAIQGQNCNPCLLVMLIAIHLRLCQLLLQFVDHGFHRDIDSDSQFWSHFDS